MRIQREHVHVILVVIHTLVNHIPNAGVQNVLSTPAKRSSSAVRVERASGRIAKLGGRLVNALGGFLGLNQPILVLFL